MLDDKGSLCTVSHSFARATTHYQGSVQNDAEESMEGLNDVSPIPPTVSRSHCCREERERKPTETNYETERDQTGTSFESSSPTTSACYLFLGPLL